MPRTKLTVTLCVVSLLVLGAGIILSKTIKIWLNTPFDPVAARRQLNHHLVASKSAKLHAAIVLYAIHNNWCLPPMSNAQEIQKALSPYISDVSIFVNPVTHHLFQPNGSLSNHRIRNIAHPSQVVAFYDIHSPEPGYDKNELVSYPKVDLLFLDGTVSTIPSYDWPKYRLASKIP